MAARAAFFPDLAARASLGGAAFFPAFPVLDGSSAFPVLSPEGVGTAAGRTTVWDRNREAFAQAGPTISYNRPEDRMMVELSLIHI